MSEKKSRTELRVGAFVVIALLIGGTLAFVIGNQRNMFQSKTEYTAVFTDVGGLRPGNTVNIAGVNVGTVDKVEFLEDGKVKVTFRVVSDSADLIRGNPDQGIPEDPDEPQPSVATVGSKGMLGDRLIDISVGDASFPEWPANRPLLADESGGLMAQAETIADDVERIAGNIRRATDPFRDQEMSNDLAETARNLARITGMLANGDGAVQRLMTDPATGDEVVATLQNLRSTSSELSRTSRAFRQIADEVRTGDGTAHAIIYGSEGREALANIGRASDELAQILGDVRTGDGTVHDLIYEDSADQLLANLTQVSEDAAFLTGEMRAGRGTIGGLLVDPSIYEDVKRLVGDLERNDILRALVRYSIRRDEAAETPTATEADGADE